MSFLISSRLIVRLLLEKEVIFSNSFFRFILSPFDRSIIRFKISNEILMFLSLKKSLEKFIRD